MTADVFQSPKEQSRTTDAGPPALPDAHHHAEQHTKHGELVRGSIIGFADGLTVPFALTAGLSAIGSSKLVILGGLAELFAGKEHMSFSAPIQELTQPGLIIGSISMGLGAYLAAVTDKKHYEVEEERERREVNECPRAEEEEIYEIFEKYSVSRSESKAVVEGLKQNEDMWVQFMMDFELKLEKPATNGAWIEGLIMGISYFFGGLLPMIPYFALKRVNHALFTSIGVTVLILILFGYVKSRVTGTGHVDAIWSACQTLIVGVVAAATSYGIVRAVDSGQSVQC